uniref:Uncharacterized protein n=2 Tax=Canis lupus familiaris TaxID=9615 RepID=A0A8C0S2B2_CANLF
MVEYLASIFGTEKDRSGPAGLGACAPGFTANKPTFSQTVVFLSLHGNPEHRPNRAQTELSHDAYVLLRRRESAGQAAAALRPRGSTGSVPAVAAATSYTCTPAPGTPDVSWVGEDPRQTSHPLGPIPAAVPEKERDDFPQTTGLAASETLVPLTSTVTGDLHLAGVEADKNQGHSTASLALAQVQPS